MAAPTHPRHHRVLRLPVLLSVVGVHHLLALLGTIFFAALVNRHPAALLALSSRNRHLLLVVPAGIAALPYFTIAFVRLAFPAAPYYVLGQRYGGQGMAWLEREAGGTPATVRWVEKAFDKARLPVVFLMPASNVVALLAGHRGMPARRFAMTLVAGIVARLVFFWALAIALAGPLTTLLGWIQRYQWWLVGLFFVVSVVQSTRSVRGAQHEHKPEEPPEDTAEDADEGRTGEGEAGEGEGEGARPEVVRGSAVAPSGDSPAIRHAGEHGDEALEGL